MARSTNNDWVASGVHRYVDLPYTKGDVIEVEV